MNQLRRLLILLLLASGTALANDGASGFDGGELRFKKLKGVEMVEETLVLSSKQVRVHYRFRNHTNKPVTTLISFPIEVSLGEDHTWDVDDPNAMVFSVRVNGSDTPFETKVQTKDDERTIHHSWKQTFLPTQDVEIEHQYTPLFGSSIMDAVAEAEFGSIAQESFCASEKEAKWMDRKKLRLDALHYILKTARTWDGPIHRFKLRIEKGDDLAVFLCTDLKIKKTADGQAFEAEATDFIPAKDLDVAFVGPRR